MEIVDKKIFNNLRNKSWTLNFGMLATYSVNIVQLEPKNQMK